MMYSITYVTILMSIIFGKRADQLPNSSIIDIERKPENTRIVNGVRAELGEFPYLISIQESSNFSHFCGGTLVTEMHVLTACHCIALHHEYFGHVIGVRYPQNISLLAGTVDLKRWRETGTRRESWKIRHHPKCVRRQTGRVYDFAMITALKPFPSEPGKIQVLELPRYRNYSVLKMMQDQVPCTVMGWGRVEFSDKQKPSRFLMKTEENLLRPSDCRKYYFEAMEKDDYLGYYYIEEVELCSLGVESRGTCQGDSGGPVICPSDNGGPILVSVNSWGVGCGSSDFPSISARTDNVEFWIRDVMAESSNTCPS